MATKKAVKEVTFIARVQFKCDHRKVVYLARSSNGVDQYETSLFDGKATGCTCPSRKPCKHMKAAECKEAGRPFAAKNMPVWTLWLVESGVLVAPKQVAMTAEQPVESSKVETPAPSPLREWCDHKISTQELVNKTVLTQNNGFSILKRVS